MIKSVTYAAEQPGIKLLVIAAIHGNEKCGTVACDRVIHEIESGAVRLVRGQVTFVPIGNPWAYELDRRFVERNLNRYLVPMKEPDCYEAKLGNILCPMLEDCEVHLSIHSYTVGGAPFIIVAPKDKREHLFASALGLYTQLTGWEEAYASTGRKSLSAKPADDEEATGSLEYARRHGAMAVTIECGQHRDPDAPEVAYRAIRNALRYLKLTDETMAAHEEEPSRLIEVKQVIYRDDQGHFSKKWSNFEIVKKGEPIAFRENGHAIVAEEDGFVIMPKEDCPIGEEWLYFGVERRA